MLRKLKLYGELAEFIGHKEFEIKVDSLSKAISFLVHNFPQAEAYINPRYYQVKVGDYAIDKNELHDPIGQQDIHIVPVISGSRGGVGKVLGGIALVGLAFIMPVAAGAGKVGLFGGLKAGSLANVGFLTKAVAGVGAMMAINGVSQMLYPVPEFNPIGGSFGGFGGGSSSVASGSGSVAEMEAAGDPRLSYNFSGTQNTGRAGVPVPLVYGEIMTGSITISGALDTNQVRA